MKHLRRIGIVTALFLIIVLLAEVTALEAQKDPRSILQNDPFDSLIARHREVRVNSKRTHKSNLRQATRREIVDREKLKRSTSTYGGALRPRNSATSFPNADPMPLSGKKYSYYPGIAILYYQPGITASYSDPTDCLRYCTDYDTMTDPGNYCLGVVMMGSTCRPALSSVTDYVEGGGYQTYLAGDCNYYAQQPNFPNDMKAVCQEVVVGTNPDPVSFSYNGMVETFTAPHLGNYTFEMWGAGGGFSRWTYDTSSGSGITVSYNLQPGQMVQVLIGSRGSGPSTFAPAGGGGGGGSFAYLDSTTPIAIGGGGGGSGVDTGSDGSTDMDGVDGHYDYGGVGGSGQSGSGGQGGGTNTFNVGPGGGGAGFNGNGADGATFLRDGLPGLGGSKAPSWEGGHGGQADGTEGGRGGFGGGGGGGVAYVEDQNLDNWPPGGGGGGGGWAGGGGGGAMGSAAGGLGGGGGGGGGSIWGAGKVLSVAVGNYGNGYGNIQYTL